MSKPSEQTIIERSNLGNEINALESLLLRAKMRLMVFDLEHFSDGDCCGDTTGGSAE